MATQLQFHNIYRDRLSSIRTRVESECKEADGPLLERLLEMNSIHEGTEVVCVGILVKIMSNRVSAIDDYGKLLNLTMPTIPSANISSEDDTVMIEDETGRIRLDLDETTATVNDIIPGFVVGVQGVKTTPDTITVNRFIYPTAPPPLVSDDTIEATETTLVVSGLRLGRPSTSQAPATLLRRWLAGKNTLFSFPKIDRLVIAGSSVAAAEEVHPDVLDKPYLDSTKVFGQLTAPTEMLDEWLADVSSNLPTTIIPGLTDPVQQALPQPPLSHLLLPRAQAAVRMPNPSHTTVSHVSAMVSAGKAIADCRRFCGLSDADIAHHCVLCGHICPTAPESLDAVALDHDPFVLKKLPRLAIFGNCREFAREEMETESGPVDIICVPDFSETGIAVAITAGVNELTVVPVKLGML
ncbi:DNA polymerase delta small subunit, POLD2 [Carpediemonas membranifera]|uniref:DNA polymerase delta small subunit, POLD2 n=1 Tax=Carpediemonas membranifera TaxID=201153 RepID=A0A8J6B1W3_9EUKA|nr:DNA polymerase delta small subunit, POLD2 [Carpediemonas membranifera]|eukprot:KAG9397490.1 DNA polymerase delta small subunit, POLD2 [Carpediemonas membranifera]